ncbi:hypothetical protein ACIBCT_38820 [Streptosporangium sp. NPDC050855]|uniref:hypothetical protein n=1 Tax=Streptosporangium sp. NPDC050855 TaxID=3366194 RepID=UPI0037A31C66
MDPELSAITAALTRLDADAARARLELAVGGSEEDAAEIMLGGVHRPPAPRGHDYSAKV